MARLPCRPAKMGRRTTNNRSCATGTHRAARFAATAQSPLREQKFGFFDWNQRAERKSRDPPVPVAAWPRNPLSDTLRSATDTAAFACNMAVLHRFCRSSLFRTPYFTFCGLFATGLAARLPACRLLRGLPARRLLRRLTLGRLSLLLCCHWHVTTPLTFPGHATRTPKTPRI